MLRNHDLAMNWRHFSVQFLVCALAIGIYWADVAVPVFQGMPWWRLDLRIATEMKRIADDQSFQSFDSTGTEAAYKAYLAAYPDGRHAVEARAKSDDAAFHEAGKQPNLSAAYDRYLTNYPQGRHVAEANRLKAEDIDQKDWLAPGSAKTVSRYRDYLKAHPNGRYANEARAAIAEMALSAITDGVRRIRNDERQAPAPEKLEADIATFLEFGDGAKIAEIARLLTDLAGAELRKVRFGEARRWSMKAAELGSAEAENMVGFQYDHGLGVIIDHSEALNWYRRAAEHGLTKAHYNIGLGYANGEGVPRDINEARAWMQKAADAGDSDAKKWLDERGLYDAAAAGDLAVVKSILDKGVSPYVKFDDGSTALMRAAANGHTQVVEALLARASNVDVRDNNGFTALMHAAASGRKETVALLLAKKADARIRTPTGTTALSVASQKGHSEIRRMLMKAGAN
jgi:TPR repeat protein